MVISQIKFYLFLLICLTALLSGCGGGTASSDEGSGSSDSTSTEGGGGSTPPPAATKTFVDTGQSLGNFSSYAVAMGDLNGDGFPDAIVANNGTADEVYLNDSYSSFSSTQSLGSFFSKDVKLKDLDGDGNLDAVIATSSNYLKAYENNGLGTLSIIANNDAIFGISGNWEALDLADVDNDGDMDIFALQYGGGGTFSRVFLNDSTVDSITFSTSNGYKVAVQNAKDIAFIDTSGDGISHAVIVTQNKSNMLYLNDGAGVFTVSADTTNHSFGDNTHNSTSAAVADIENDGDQDVIVSNYGQANEVYINDGAGNFSLQQSIGTSSTMGLSIADINGDGFADLFFTNDLEPDEVWLNDGTGNFTNSELALGGNSKGRDAVLVDMDGDSDFDLFVANNGEPNSVWKYKLP